MGRAPNVIIVFHRSMATMVRRALQKGRAEHREDLRRRLETHYACCAPVLTFYQQRNLLRSVCTARRGAGPGSSAGTPAPECCPTP